MWGLGIAGYTISYGNCVVNYTLIIVSAMTNEELVNFFRGKGLSQHILEELKRMGLNGLVINCSSEEMLKKFGFNAVDANEILAARDGETTLPTPELQPPEACAQPPPKPQSSDAQKQLTPRPFWTRVRLHTRF